MVAVPAVESVVCELQDNRGFRSLTRADGFFDADISIDANTISGQWAQVNAIAAAIAAMSNAKLVGVTWAIRYGIAQEPSSETGEYQLVTEKARLQGGTGNGHYNSLSIPAPKDALFLTTTQDNLIVVNPGSSLVSALQTATAAFLPAPDGGHPFALFFGGELRGTKPRRRRVLQGQ